MTLGISLRELPKESVIYCKQPTFIGLFEQCQQVLVQTDFGARVRVYSIPREHVETIPKRNLFRSSAYKVSDKVKKGELIGITSSNLWNSSSAGFASLCKVDDVLGNGLLEISCGSVNRQTILKIRVQKISPY